MGQKINPIGLRLGIIRTWDSRWYADDKYADMLHEDLRIREMLLKRLSQAGVSKVVIELLRQAIAKMTESEVHVNIVEIRKPEIDAQLVAENIAQQMERRISVRRAMKRVVQSAMRMGAKGIRVNCSGRLGGAEIARTVWYHEGRVPLHTLRANIDYGTATGRTTYGACGVKVWIYKGEILEHDPMAMEKQAADQQPAR